MTFEVAAEAYDRFMGRFSQPLAAELADHVGVRAGQRALDVGCGPGALTTVLAERLGAASVAAVDPSESFVAACRSRLPEVDVRRASAEDLPFEDETFDVALANLVVHFMRDPVAGLSEMARVVRPGGAVAATVWDHSGDDTGPLSLFWRAVKSLRPGHPGESLGAGAGPGELLHLFSRAGFGDSEDTAVLVRAPIASFEDWWEPMTYGIGPAGAYVAQLTDEEREELRQRCRELLPETPFAMPARAWCVTARRPEVLTRGGGSPSS
jgi:ubiquinone/menaquinone biosynthesis C-methylase UbiE